MEINKENAKHQFTWDYEGHGRTFTEPFIIETELDGEQFTYDAEEQNRIDWNQTIMGPINHISVDIKRKSIHSGALTMVVSENVRPLIESLAYFNKDESKLSGKFNVSFTNEHDNSILISLSSDNLQAVPIFETTQERGEDFETIRLVAINKLTEEEIIEYKKNLIGHIEIINYNG